MPTRNLGMHCVSLVIPGKNAYKASFNQRPPRLHCSTAEQLKLKQLEKSFTQLTESERILSAFPASYKSILNYGILGAEPSFLSAMK